MSVPQTTLHQLSVPEDASGTRLDLYLVSAIEGASRKGVKRALDRGMVFVDGATVRRAGTLLQGGEAIRLSLEIPPPETSPSALPIIYRDEFMVAINKPSRLPSHPNVAGVRNAIDLLRWQLKLGDEAPLILLHRLDADTSGVLLFALSREANRHLSSQFSERKAVKRYLALVNGNPPESFERSTPLKAGPRGKVLEVRSGGKPALTRFRTLKSADGIALIEAFPKTGRTHQIRVHVAGAGFPLLGDRLYGGVAEAVVGGETVEIPHHQLHAASLTIEHPESGTPITIEAPLPELFLRFYP